MAIILEVSASSVKNLSSWSKLVNTRVDSLHQWCRLMVYVNSLVPCEMWSKISFWKLNCAQSSIYYEIIFGMFANSMFFI